MRHRITLGFAVLLLAVSAPIAQAQRIVHTPPASVEAGDGIALRFQLAGATPEMVLEAAAFYRSQGDLAYRRVAARTDADGFVAMLPNVPVTTGQIEYYLIAELNNGSIISLPTISPTDNPFRVTVTVPRPDGPMLTTVADIEFRIMSPLPGVPMTTDDLLIAVALFPQSELAVSDSIRLSINGTDVTHAATITPYIVTYVPDAMPPGSYRAELTYRFAGRTQRVTEWAFTVVPPGGAVAAQTRGRQWVNGEIDFVGRSQSISGNNLDFARGSTSLYGTAGLLSYGVNGLLTSQEDARLQPQNKYGAYLRVGHYLGVEGGHVYPDLNPLVLSGRRVFGVNARSSLLWRMFNVNVVAGELNRRVSTLYTPIQEEVTERAFGDAVIRDTTFALRFRPNGAGTYRRDILAARVALGSGRFAQLGINALKVRDAVGSISVVDSLKDPDSARYLSGLTTAQRNWLNANPEAFRPDLSNPKPQDNIVAAADFRLNLHGGRIQLAADGAVSALNNDISAGPLSQKYLDDLGVTLDADILDRIDQLSWLLIINENMAKFPVRFKNDEAEVFVPTSIFAYQSRMGLNYLGHNLNVQYRWVGPDYISLANNGIRRDVAGYSVSDRFRLLRNTVYLNLQYENLWDNLSGQLPARTTTTNTNGSLGWYPVNFRLPRVNLSVRHQLRDNSILPQNELIDPSRLDVAIRHIRIESVSPDTVVTTLATPRRNETWQYGLGLSQTFWLLGMSHDASLNLTSIRTDDVRFRYGDFRTTSGSLGLVSDALNLPLRTSLNVGYTLAEAQSGLTDITLMNLLAGIRYDFFDDRLTLNTELGIVSAKTVDVIIDIDDNGTQTPFDDFYVPDPTTETASTSLNYQGSVSADYRFLQRHVLSLSMSYTKIDIRSASTVVPPNDYYLQVRYGYQF
jgi:hypothetical protein